MQRLLLPLCLAAFLPIYSNAQSARSMDSQILAATEGRQAALTLAQALELANRYHPDLAAAGYEIQAWEGSVRQAGVIPNPDLVATVEDHKSEYRTSAVQLNQPIELGGKRSARISSAERGRDSASIDLEAKRLEVRAAVIAAFYDLLIAQERHSLAKRTADFAKRTTDMTAKRVIAGKISPVEENKARIAESSARMELAQAATELSTSRQRLKLLLGAANPDFEQAQGDLTALPRITSYESLLARMAESPQMQRAKAELAHRQAITEVERSKRIGDLTIGLGARREEQIGRTQAVVGVSIPLPLFDRNQGNLQEALSRTEKARQELAGTEMRLQSELMQTLDRFNTASQEAKMLHEEVLPAAQKTYEAAVKGFEYGKFGSLDLLDAQRTFMQTQAQYLRSLNETYRTYAELERLAGPLNQISPMEKP